MVALISLPIGILAAFIVMKLQGLNANIMSLGGIAIAIGAMVDGAIVVVENLHKHIHQHAVSSSQGASAHQVRAASQGLSYWKKARAFLLTRET